MNAKAREIVEKISVVIVDDGPMAEIESIIAEALAEKDKEIARMREAITTFAKGQAWAAQGWKDQPHIKPLFDIAALLPPAAKEVER